MSEEMANIDAKAHPQYIVDELFYIRNILEEISKSLKEIAHTLWETSQ